MVPARAPRHDDRPAPPPQRPDAVDHLRRVGHEQAGQLGGGPLPADRSRPARSRPSQVSQAVEVMRPLASDPADRPATNAQNSSQRRCSAIASLTRRPPRGHVARHRWRTSRRRPPRPPGRRSRASRRPWRASRQAPRRPGARCSHTRGRRVQVPLVRLRRLVADRPLAKVELPAPAACRRTPASGTRSAGSGRAGVPPAARGSARRSGAPRTGGADPR